MERLRHYFHADMAALLETDPDVLRWTTEVEPFRFQDAGGDIVFTPNFRVSDIGGTRVIRLVRDEDIKDARREERHRLLKKLFRLRGIDFDVLTDAQIAADPRLGAAKEILFHRYWDVPDDMRFQVAAMADSGQPATLGELHARFGGDVHVWPQLLSLVAQGFVEIDARRGLTAGTPVRRCKLAGYQQ